MNRIAGAVIVCILLCGLALAMKGRTIKDSQEGKQTTDKETQAAEQTEKREDLTQVYADLISAGTKEFYQGHAVDQSFFMWMTSEYGEEAVKTLAQNVVSLNGEELDSELWYEVTGKTMHTLWAEYCMKYGYYSYETENTTVIECKSEDKITLDFIGDINLDSSWCTMQTLNEQKDGIKDCISEQLIAELNDSDMAIVNNEFTFSKKGKAVAGKDYTFRADPENVSLLNDLGIDMAVLANNHSFDYGEAALLDTVQTLQGAGIISSGAGENIKQASLIHYVIANGRKLAFVSATEVEKYSTYTQEADEDTPGVFKMLDPQLFLSVVQEADENSDYVIAYVHWGQEGECYYSGSQHDLAAKIVDAGADVIVGGHPHRLQGVEFIDGTPVVYSLGNFWFSTGNLFTAVAQIQIDKDGAISLTMLPCNQKDVKTSVISDKDLRTRFYQYLADMSTKVACDVSGNMYDFGTSDKTAQKVYDQLEDSGAEWYVSGQAYSNHSSGFDLDGKQIDVVGNLR